MNLWYAFMRFLIWVCTGILFRTRIIGRENIPDGNFVLIANHHKFWDPIIILRSFRRELYFMAKKELFKIPILGSLIRSMNAFPVDRSANDLGAIRYSLSIVKRGGSLVIFPEGTRVSKKMRSNFKEGAALISSLADAPLLPITIEGNYKLFCTLSITIHKPIYIQTFPQGMDRKEIRKEILDRAYRSIYGEEGFYE